MNINGARTETYGSPKSSAQVQNVGGNITSEQGATKPFSAARRQVKHESPSPVPEEGARRLGCLGCLDSLMSRCFRQTDDQRIPERKVSHNVATDNVLIDSGNAFASPERPFSGSLVIDPGSRNGTLLTDPSIISENRASTTGGCEAIVVVAGGGSSKTFTAEEAVEALRKTIKSLLTSLKYSKISRGEYDPDQKDEVISIFIDFILYQEGLVNDRCFTVASSPDRFVAGKTVSKARLEEIQSFLSDIFTERAAESGKIKYEPILRYSLESMLVDYLNKKENIPDDVTPRILSLTQHDFAYRLLLADIFPFFETILAGRGLFSELGFIFDFAVRFRQQIADSIAICGYKKLLTTSLRINKSNMREYFNRNVLDVIFFSRCDGIINTMVDDCSLPAESVANPARRLDLKFGEELEYDVADRNVKSASFGRLVDIFASRIREKGMNPYPPIDGTDRARYGLDHRFTVTPFYDTDYWFEINCTPYHSDNPFAESCFEKVIEVVDSMRKDELIGYSSGHKHIDALSATQGDTGVLLAMESEIQRNPFLLRAFGNNDRIVQKDEANWYKTFADYNPDTKPFAVKRLNLMIDRYNRKIDAYCAEKLRDKKNTYSEKKDRLKQFAHFYSQFVHMTTIQKGLGTFRSGYMEKYMAMTLLHITGASNVNELSTLEFRFFRCPKTVQEIKLINQFLQAWFRYVHQCRKNKIPLESVPVDIKSCKDYTAEQVQVNTINYLKKLGLNPEDYRCFWGEVRDKI